MDALHFLVVGREQRDSAIEDRDLYDVVGQKRT
jgi:hypothetical protein